MNPAPARPAGESTSPIQIRTSSLAGEHEILPPQGTLFRTRKESLTRHPGSSAASARWTGLSDERRAKSEFELQAPGQWKLGDKAGRMKPAPIRIQPWIPSSYTPSRSRAGRIPHQVRSPRLRAHPVAAAQPSQSRAIPLPKPGILFLKAPC